MKFGKLVSGIFLGLGLLSLASCGNNKEAATSKASEPITIEYWHVNADTQGGKTVTELVEGYNKSQDQVKVVAKYNPDMYKGLMQNLQASVASNKEPDVIQVGWAFKDYFADNFEYTAPTDLVKEYDPDNADFFEKHFLKNIMALSEKDGKTIGIPYSISNAVLYINKDMLKAAGLDENGPKTWEEVQSFSNTMREKTGKYGVYIQEASDNWAVQGIVESNGGKMLNGTKATFATKEGVEAYTLYQKMVLDQAALHTTWEQGIQSFIDGNVGMLYTTIAQRNNVQNNATFDVGTVKSPSWGSKEVKLPTGGAMLSVTSKDEQKKKAAWDFLSYLYSVESISQWTEGTGYLPARKDVADADDGLKTFLAENKLMDPALAQMDKMVSWTCFPGTAGLEAEQKLLDMRDKVLAGADVKQTMEETQKEINTLMEGQ